MPQNQGHVIGAVHRRPRPAEDYYRDCFDNEYRANAPARVVVEKRQLLLDSRPLTSRVWE